MPSLRGLVYKSAVYVEAKSSEMEEIVIRKFSRSLCSEGTCTCAHQSMLIPRSSRHGRPPRPGASGAAQVVAGERKPEVGRRLDLGGHRQRAYGLESV